MVSLNGPSGSGSKRKSVTKSASPKAHKAARVGAGHVSPAQNTAHSRLSGPNQPPLSQSCFNYLNSGVPHRIMFYKQGGWLNFPKSVAQILIAGFKDEKTSIKFSIGDSSLLFDFLSMAIVNLHTKKQKPIAWIDEAEKCFFPTAFGQDDDDDDDDDDCDEWDFGTMESELQIKEAERSLVPQPDVVKPVMTEIGAKRKETPPTMTELLSTKLDVLGRDSESFLFAQNLFLFGMGPFAKPHNIVAIRRYAPKDISGKKMLENFEKQIRVTAEERGDANVHHGWFGAGISDLVGVLIHGFAMMCGKVTEKGPLGTALYLTHESRSYASVKLCDIDEKGVQHMILCRVMLGKTEQVNLGSKQFFPSSGEYDSGVDNRSCPKCYVIWPTHLSSYVHPEYLVSFRLGPNARDYLFGLQDVRCHFARRLNVTVRPTCNSANREPNRPTSLCIPFQVLLLEIKDKVTPMVLELLLLHAQEVKNKTLSRNDMIKRLKYLVEDQIVVSAVLKLRREPSSWSAGGVVKTEELAIPNSNANGEEVENTGISGSTAPPEPNGPNPQTES